MDEDYNSNKLKAEIQEGDLSSIKEDERDLRGQIQNETLNGSFNNSINLSGIFKELNLVKSLSNKKFKTLKESN